MAIGPEEVSALIDSKHPERLERARRIVDQLETLIDEQIKRGQFVVEGDGWDRTVVRVPLLEEGEDWHVLDRFPTETQSRIFGALEDRYRMAGWEGAKVEFQSRSEWDQSVIRLTRKNERLV